MLHKLRRLGRRIRLYKLPKTLLLNNINLNQDELAKVLAENRIEREWYKHLPRYDNLAQILAAAGTGHLVPVTPTDNYRPILRLMNPKLAEMYPGYLSPEAKALLDEIGQNWRAKMNQQGIDSQIKLAVTSLVRTQTYQNTIVRAGKLADPQSVHCEGQALDIDGSGYYLGDTPINARAQKHPSFVAAFKELGAEIASPEYGDYHLYQPEVHTLLAETLEEMQADGKLHFLAEYTGTTNQCFHVCVAPGYNGARQPQ